MTSSIPAPALHLTLILPTYNEAGNILPLLDDLQHTFANSLTLIVVDDQSPDGTASQVGEYAASHPNVRLINRTGPPGLVLSLAEGLASTATPLVGWMDADGSMPAHTMARLLQAVLDGADAAVASRFAPGGKDIRATNFQSALQIILSHVLSGLGRWMVHPGFRDWSSGCIVLRRECLQDHALQGDYGEYFIALMHHLLHHRKARVVEVPYVLGPRLHGQSKTATNVVGLVRRGRKYLSMLWRLKFNP
jgi:dolichol-phosphate mannosyltransferase